MTGYEFYKSSYSTVNGDCVEVAVNVPGTIAVRDSKDPEGPTLLFTPTAWLAFHEALAIGAFTG